MAAFSSALSAELSAQLGTVVRAAAPVSGGCISRAFRVELSDGERLLVKTHARGAIFQEEARSLAVLRSAGAVRVPFVRAHGSGWLALEWLEPGSGGVAGWERLGHSLAALHRTRAERFGWDTDNYIGPLEQSNRWQTSWPTFWWEARLLPQLERAYAQGYFVRERKRFDALGQQLDERLAPAAAEGPSLLHGDLWSGNAHPTQGEVALIDPASYYGHREVDLAMAELFGGFPSAFHTAYDEAWPLEAESAAMRRAIYQLYYLLVHVNLFGAAYVAQTVSTLGRAQGSNV